MRMSPLLFSFFVPALLAAQSDTSGVAVDSQPAVVVQYTFTSPKEFTRVMLQAGQQYAAEVSSAGARLEVRPLLSGVQQPRIQSALAGSSASKGSYWIITPFADAEYEIRCLGIHQGHSTELTVTRRPPAPAKEPHE